MENIRSLRVFEMSVARKILGCSRRDHRRNTDILNELSIKEDTVDVLRARRLSYFGHVARMHLNRYLHILLHGHISGVRSRGRPQRRWTDNITEDCDALHLFVPEAVRLAQNRTSWRNWIRNRGDEAAGVRWFINVAMALSQVRSYIMVKCKGRLPARPNDVDVLTGN